MKQNENILRLRELTDNIEKETKSDYKSVVRKLKSIVDEGKVEIQNSDSPQSKIKCYETMCSTITNLLMDVKLV